MENYIAYGLEIESVFTLPELRPGQSDGEPDIVIESASLTPVDTEADADGERQVDVGPDRCRISYDGVGTFLVENGDRILVDPLSPEIPSTKVFRRLLEGQILGVCCHQRDLLVLHGSAVQIDGGAVVFLGPTGAGKSTTAAAFYGEGYPLLDDDIVVIDSLTSLFKMTEFGLDRRDIIAFMTWLTDASREWDGLVYAVNHTKPTRVRNDPVIASTPDGIMYFSISSLGGGLHRQMYMGSFRGTLSRSQDRIKVYDSSISSKGFQVSTVNEVI